MSTSMAFEVEGDSVLMNIIPIIPMYGRRFHKRGMNLELILSLTIVVVVQFTLHLSALKQGKLVICCGDFGDLLVGTLTLMKSQKHRAGKESEHKMKVCLTTEEAGEHYQSKVEQKIRDSITILEKEVKLV
jgi:hypothetical protein